MRSRAPWFFFCYRMKMVDERCTLQVSVIPEPSLSCPLNAQHRKWTLMHNRYQAFVLPTSVWLSRFEARDNKTKTDGNVSLAKAKFNLQNNTFLIKLKTCLCTKRPWPSLTANGAINIQQFAYSFAYYQFTILMKAMRAGSMMGNL